ncbi:MaoC family dehydratase N-terminal domain-containing protein [Variovorax paradoxus]|nr:MaoC family dehydratase N-terminal domain-containing protein [Variovorax paradoxus]MBT2302007.1 MaoC family dehydratase N-terminal domain-containing protein [Variovorax paradoxus]MBT2326693.1 MaoC family dehydratase N-terminal domain-containing protein [Variovorax paradoxus]
MLDKTQIGKSLRRVTRNVEAGQLRFFLDVIGDKEKAFRAKQAGTPLQVPPTYFFCLEMMDDPDPLDWLKGLGVNLLHILHGQQRFDYHASAFAGDELTFEASIQDIQEKKGGALQFVLKKTEVTNQHGTRIATASSTVIYRDPVYAKGQ